MRKHNAVLLGTLFLFLFAATLPALAGVLDERLEKRLELMRPGEEITVVVMMAEQADIRAIDAVMKEERATRQIRHRAVVEALRDVAITTQSSFLSYLYEKKNAGEVSGYTPHWITNLVVVRTGKSTIMEIAQRQDVDVVFENPEVSLIEPVTKGGGSVITGIGVPPGVRAIKADSVWYTLGITGAGRIVANLDTGVDGTHPALASRWRGTEPGVDPSEAWLDVLGGSPNFPTDFYGHGTHVMGTETGLGAGTGDTVGVAWGAHWIACNAINQGVGPEFDNDVVNGFEWLADPDGNPGTIDDVPDVVQNSWGINEGFGYDYTDCDSRWWAAIDNCEAAGVVVTFSAGNEGPGPTSLRSPADRATTPYTVFSIGAVDATNYDFPYPIAGFSSRGPSGCDDVSIKPEVCAPGVDVYSSVPGGGYEGGWSGTSMAGPHVAGVVALMRELDPNLPVDEVKDILMRTAHDFGSSGEDNTYGMGFIDALAACLEVGRDEIRGIVRNTSTGNVMDSVRVEVASMSKSDFSDQYGFYSMKADFPESVQVSASFVGYGAPVEWVDVVQEGVTYHNIWMDPVNPGYVAGYVRDIDTGDGIGGVATVYSGHLVLTYTNVDSGTGWYVMEVPEGSWTLTVDPENPYLRTSEPGVVVTRDDTTFVDFDLAALTEFVEVGGGAGIVGGGFGQGVSFVDYDGDGDEDILVANLFGPNRFYRNLGGSFAEIAAAVGLAGEGRAFAGVWADPDRDGDPDCFVTQRNGYDALYRNDGGTFTEVAGPAGVAGETWDYSQGAAWVDVDGDGWVDLYVANKLGANDLYRNVGGTFVEVGAAWGVADPSASAGVSVADYDNDGDSDIYVVNMNGESNVLYRNDGGYFTDVSAVMGVDHAGNGRGSSWGDMDGDGDMDLFVADVGADVLYRNDGTGFTEVTGPAGLGDTGSANGCSFLDYDNDGDMDIVVVTGTAILLYLNDGAGVFLEVGDLVGLSGALGVGVASADLDADGDLDIFVARSNYVGDLLFQNLGNNNTWLNVRLSGAKSDKNGIGARIDAWAGTRHYVRDVVTGTGLYSQDSITSEIGLLREASVDSVVVSWPSGKRTKLTNLAAEQTLTVREAMPKHKVPVNLP